MKKHAFERFNLHPTFVEVIEKKGFYEPTDIQSKVIPLVLKKESIVGQSQTGTGKSHAYLLPVLSSINVENHEVQAVITAPTRELALQLFEHFKELVAPLPESEKITGKCLIGGTDKQRTIEKLDKQPQVIIGTPGRILDLVKEQALDIHKTNMLVVDEADIMLDMGFIHDVDQLAGRMPEKLQILVFSATIPEKLKPFLKKYMENPKYVHIDPKTTTPKKIEHILIPLKSRTKAHLTYNILTSINPYLALVFANTKEKVDEYADALISKGLKVARFHGGLTPRERKRIMKQIRDLEYQYVIATDLAARGIDIEGVSHVINMEIPKDLDFYIHRTGRTGRADLAGIAITIYEPSDEHALNELEKRGITFQSRDLVKGEWQEIPDRNRRKKRERADDGVEQKVAHRVRKPGKVKPGYKKKMKYEIENLKKKERRKNARKK
ncbi:DEAD/DEAH box helicase [Bacillus carboniphilus]|uniref:DEAD-box ATP-dependent RNA helicase CshB n=1 Tax=Bacillus carboniphilus TaxID=86663 RepID=A0ABN0WLM6_9BACI